MVEPRSHPGRAETRSRTGSLRQVQRASVRATVRAVWEPKDRKPLADFPDNYYHVALPSKLLALGLLSCRSHCQYSGPDIPPICLVKFLATYSSVAVIYMLQTRIIQFYVGITIEKRGR